MNAGRDLDALIALQVFHYTLDYEFADTLGAPCVRELRDQYDEWGILPHYSTDIGDAWLVVERLAATPYWIGVIVGTFGIPHVKCYRDSKLVAEEWIDLDNIPDSRSLSARCALAICRAALAICGVPS